MQALLPPYNRPAMSSSTTQNSLPWGTQWLTLRTSRQRAAGPWTRCWSHWNIYRGVFCCFCAEWLKGETSEAVCFPADSLSCLKRKSQEKLKENTIKIKNCMSRKLTIYAPECLSVYIKCVSEEMCRRCLKFEDIDKKAWITYNPSPSVQADNNTSGVSCPGQTVFVKHVRVTEQQ